MVLMVASVNVTKEEGNVVRSFFNAALIALFFERRDSNDRQ